MVVDKLAVIYLMDYWDKTTANSICFVQVTMPTAVDLTINAQQPKQDGYMKVWTEWSGADSWKELC